MTRAARIEIRPRGEDSSSSQTLAKLQKIAPGLTNALVVRVVTVAKDLTDDQLADIADAIHNPLIEIPSLKPTVINDFDHALEIGYLPGVTDNVATTTSELICDLFKTEFAKDDQVASSTLYFLRGSLNHEELKKVKAALHNNLIQRCHYLEASEYALKGMPVMMPRVDLKNSEVKVTSVNLEVSDEELMVLGKQGIRNEDGTFRGPLALTLNELHVIRDYFRKEGRQPTDIELECIAQTWSEHCKHKIFASPIDEVAGGLYKSYIKKATETVRQNKGADDFCVSVFKDNSGAIKFNENYYITDKAETHNSPSALDPFGGAITGVVGVNRDTLGFGKGAKPIANRYGFCFGMPNDDEPIYRDKDLTDQALKPKTIIDGVVHGIEAGGNQSGVPGPQGFIYFHDRYKGKPLVFAGTIGLIPKEVGGMPSYEKGAQAGDLVVVIGGRVGQDGIHGATFSSESLDEGSPSTAVQIGDAITQKRFMDAILTEARKENLYNSITDNGAGGISCSVPEMARECGGCRVDLEKVPLKYANLEPWKIWISESQERMTLAVEPSKWPRLQEIFKKHGTEATVIGEFTNDGHCKISYNNEPIFNLSMEFLHEGVPLPALSTKKVEFTGAEPQIAAPNAEQVKTDLLNILAQPNIASYAYVSTLFDHEVQGNSIVKPLQGKGLVNNTATIIKPDYKTWHGAVLSQALNPFYSEIDSYHMAASAIDSAIRNAVAVGANPDHLALMDNFCWCSSDEPERLYQLKKAAEACYDYAVAYGAPYISGKDSMFNDFKGFNAKGESVKISVPPTLLISGLGVIPDVRKALTLDTKVAGDLVYVLGKTANELGGSEYYNLKGELGANVPKVNSAAAYKRYKTFYEAVKQEIFASATSVGLGGLAVGLQKSAIAGQLGLEIDLNKLLVYGNLNTTQLLFSETQSRIIVTIDPQHQTAFEELFHGQDFALVGKVIAEQELRFQTLEGAQVAIDLADATNAYNSGNQIYQ